MAYIARFGMKIIKRETYLNQLFRVKGTPDIKVITGIRRAGKSFLLKDFAKTLLEKYSNINLISIDLTDLENEKLLEYHSLYNHIEGLISEDKDNVLIIDEVQLCPKFELAINSLHSKNKCDIYLTGSNAFMFSSALATLFTGRHIEIHILPFSYKEYLEYYEQHEGTSIFNLDEYALKGGLSGSYMYNAETDRLQYLSTIYETILNKDLVLRNKITDLTLINRITDFLMDNVGSIVSIPKIANTLTSNQHKTNHVTVGNYIKYLVDAFVVYHVRKWDIKGKKYLNGGGKYYLSDTGIRFAKLGTRKIDYGHIYENLVFLELKRRGYDIYVGQFSNGEVDFVTIKNGEIAYFQVSDDISRQSTLERELRPLTKIPDSYPKFLIANTGHPPTDYDGIKILDLKYWLLS